MNTDDFSVQITVDGVPYRAHFTDERRRWRIPAYSVRHQIVTGSMLKDERGQSYRITNSHQTHDGAADLLCAPI